MDGQAEPAALSPLALVPGPARDLHEYETLLSLLTCLGGSMEYDGPSDIVCECPVGGATYLFASVIQCILERFKTVLMKQIFLFFFVNRAKVKPTVAITDIPVKNVKTARISGHCDSCGDLFLSSMKPGEDYVEKIEVCERGGWHITLFCHVCNPDNE